MSDVEKVYVDHASEEYVDDNKLKGQATRKADNQAIIDSFTPQEQRKIVRRVDVRLVLVLGALYAVSLMDRTNLGNAVIAGMAVDLKLIGARYSIITLIFFVSILFKGRQISSLIGPRSHMFSSNHLRLFCYVKSVLVSS